MNSTDHAEKATWVKRAKLAIAGVALAALALFGGLGMSNDAVDVGPDVEEEAGGTWSFTSGGGKWGKGRCAGTNGATWS